jgi:hypothetical protein
LLLLDIGLTFFVVLCYYLYLTLRERPNYLKSFLLGLSLFFCFLTKITALIYLFPLFVISVYDFFLKHKNYKKDIFSLLIPWPLFICLATLYLVWKYQIIIEIFEYHHFTELIIGITPLIFIFFIPIIIGFRNNGKLVQFFEKSKNKLLIVFYSIIVILFIVGDKRPFYARFYLRSIIIATSIPLSALFYISPYFTFLGNNYALFILLFWSFTPLFIPNAMFKYQVPSFPPIFILTVYSITKLFDSQKKQIRIILTLFAFSISITYFFFLPMIRAHVKNNIRNGVNYVNKKNINEISLTMYPLGEWGSKFVKSINKPNKCPLPPSLVDIVDFWTPAEVGYLTRDELLRKLQTGQDLPESVFLVYHLDVPVVEDPELIKLLEEKYSEGPMFDRAY